MERVPLRKLPSNSRHHVARVQVVRVFEPTQNEGKARFQRVVLKDGEGDKVRLTLFGDNIDIYSSILPEDSLYDVSNVTMKNDLAAIVVRVGALEGKHTRSGRPVDMAKLYLTDESCDDVVPVVLWGSVAHEGCKFVGQEGSGGQAFNNASSRDLD